MMTHWELARLAGLWLEKLATEHPEKLDECVAITIHDDYTADIAFKVRWSGPKKVAPTPEPKETEEASSVTTDEGE